MLQHPRSDFRPSLFSHSVSFLFFANPRGPALQDLKGLLFPRFSAASKPEVDVRLKTVPSQPPPSYVLSPERAAPVFNRP